VVTQRAELRAEIAARRRAGQRIGFVPTMGALHAGHLSLVAACRQECDCAVVSIFVNPTQFGPGEDFDRYPRPFQDDLARLAAEGADLVFAPATAEVYGADHATFVDVGAVGEPLEGRHRPGHFRGVATVVLKLFNLVAPDVAYFGRKDYQQSLVVRRMVADLDLPIEIRVCPIVREADGLALSSRNVYLSPSERRQALVLSRGLRVAADLAARGERNAAAILAAMRGVLAGEPAVQVDYAAIVDAATLAEVTTLDRPAVALVAARVGRTRLIDNELIDGGS
jgi:pantoate--beta-alanine ligase